ncbi:bifunctional diguanylate cyclase/phosphodiesterase [Pseudorhodoferax soli]|uniref:PAS domain S-box-containing protein/diguanylate cyclase (GGDEF)-like protein n=1 Tax=Pseudorhodoferax soli TaxID=545864 RepID=A0A368XSE3_9BURK|nr:EAL domain-containing protein [Pseudorhodoferax soli]RCW70419.1 PAS domain S-box-containing protein/diguanylate cyclase (GGDEF)-like protein [Pseudorhodoferax soli]
MHLLSSSETSTLNARFSRLLQWGLLSTAVACLAWGALSIAADRREVQAQVERNNIELAASLRIHVDQVLDQTAFSLRGIRDDLQEQRSVVPASAQAAPDAVLAAMRNAMRYDPVSAVLFVREPGGQVYTVGREGRAAPELAAQILQLTLPAGNAEPALLAPVQRQRGEHDLPMVLPVGDATGRVVGALIPLGALHGQHAASAAGAHSGSGLYLKDGTGLTRSAHADRVRGKRVPEAIRLSEHAAAQPQGAFDVPGFGGHMLSVGYQRSERYPFIAASGVRHAVYLAPWQQRSAGKVAMLTLGLAALAWFARSLLRLNAALVSSGATYRRLFQDISDAVLLTTESGTVAGLNDAATALLGVPDKAQAIGHDLRAFYRVLHADQELARPFARVRAGEHLRFGLTVQALRNRQQIDIDVRLGRIDAGGRRLLMYTIRDVSAERRHVRQQEYLASHDVLTGLPNRHLLLRTLDRRIEEQPGEQVHLVVINLLRFREVNESFGPRQGDTVLEVCAQRLAKALAPLHWTLFRASGCDFAALGTGVHGLPALEGLCSRIFTVLREPITVADASVELQARIGSALFPEDALDASELLRCAAIAVLQSPPSVNRWTPYSRVLDQAPGRNLKLRAELGTAIRTGQLQLFYQPKLGLEDRSVVGAEALLRWHHAERGWISPGEFIPLAESTELIHPLTRWVLAEAIEQIHAWSAAGSPLAVAVNVSANNLRDPDFTGHVKALLSRRGIAPGLLELEVTEGALAHNPEIVLRRLQELRDFGIGLSLDDFGTGFSSLAYVRQFPFTSIKIDRSFVDAMLDSPRDWQVTKSTITLGRELGLTTVAEGVENDQTAIELLALECDIGQGYLFGRPMPAADFDGWRRGHAERHAHAGALARGAVAG